MLGESVEAPWTHWVPLTQYGSDVIISFVEDIFIQTPPSVSSQKYILSWEIFLTGHYQILQENR